MTDKIDPRLLVWWENNLEDLDHEIARLALLCQVKILEPGVIDRILRKDASVSGTDNSAAFKKLRDLLMMHLAIRDKAVKALGQARTAGIEAYIVERLTKIFPDLEGKWPPGA